MLLQNLRMLGNLRREGKISYLSLNFCMQRANYQEMPAFVKLGQEIGVDEIFFQRMVNYGNQTKKQLQYNSMFINDEYFEYDLWKILQEVLKDPIVSSYLIKQQIEASDKKYCNMDEKSF